MGVIRRQGAKKTIVLYFGVLIGIVSTLYIYPLEEEVYGLARFLHSMAGLLAPILSLGTMSLVVRFFPTFRDKKTGHHGFLGLMLLLLLVSFLVVGSVLFLLRNSFYDLLQTIDMDVTIFSNNLMETGILALFIFSSAIITSYVSNFRRITIPGIFNSIYVKIGMPLLIMLYYYQIIQIYGFKIGFILLYILIFISLLVYTSRLGELYLKPDFSFLSGKLLKKMAGYSSYGIFAGLGSTIAFRIDAIMTASLMGFGSTGVFSIADNIASVIVTPYSSISEISAPIIAQNMNDGDLDKVDKLYKTSAITLLIIGLGLLLIVYVSIDDIFSLSAQYETLIQGEKVVLILGLAKVVDMATGLNNMIIGYSHLYRWNLYLILLLGALNVTLNLTFIPKFGITGAALATLTSMLIFNIFKFIIVWVKFKMQPFTRKYFWVMMIGGLAYFLGTILPDSGYHLLNIGLKSGITALVFGGLALYFNISPDINAFVKSIFDRIIKMLRI